MSNVVSQEWFQVGSTWYFNEQELLEFPAHGYTVHSVEKDTIINNLNSKMIKIERYNYFNQLKKTNHRIVREEEDKVYHWNGKEFRLIYDFSLSVGDTLAIEVGSTCESSSPIIVDSITELIVGDIKLNVQHFSFNYESDGESLVFWDSIIERIGSIRTFLYKPECNIDIFGTYLLRCYSDSELYYRADWFGLSFPGAPCDTAIYDPTFVPQEPGDHSNQVFPNPFFSTVHIRHLNTEIRSITIFNQFGQQVKHNELRCMEVELELADLEAGFYFCLIETAASLTCHKLLKIDQ